MKAIMLLAAVVGTAALTTANPARASAQTDTASARTAAVRTDTPAAAPAAARRRRPRHNSTVISEAELAERHERSAYEAVSMLRPQWLLSRGVGLGGNSAIMVYRDGAQIGSVGQLSQIDLRTVKEIRYYDGIQATQRFGTGYDSGAIDVILK